MLGIVYFCGAMDNISDYLKCEEEIAKAVYLKVGSTYLTYMFIILAVGFALTAIIYLLRHIAYKDE